MKKSLLLGGVICFGLMRPVFAEWITCREAVKDWGIIDAGDVIMQCGSSYGDECYYDTSSGSIDCNHVSSSCTCPSGYSGTCSGTNYSTCYKSCSAKCNQNLKPTNCPTDAACDVWYDINTEYMCSGTQYYGSSCRADCACPYDITEIYKWCPDGYRDCGDKYKYGKGETAEDSCCKNTTAGTYVKTANGTAVVCESGYYCPGGVKVYYGLTGGKEGCPGSGASGGGKSLITDCYLPSGTPFSDTTGSGKYTADCYYK